MADLYHRHMTQRVYSDPHWRVNCTAYCGAMLFGDATLGGCTITGRLVRAMSNEPTPSASSPGLNNTQIINVGKKLYIPIYDNQGQSWSQVMDAIDAGKRVLISLDYATLGKWRAQAGGDFGHAFVIIRDSERNPTKFLRGSDPLASESRRYPKDVIHEAARVFARKTGQRTGLRWCSTRVVPETVKSID